MSNLTLALHCRVCDTNFDNKLAWLHHLTQDSHLTLARDRLLNRDEAVNECVLMVLGKLPVGNDARIIEYLTNGFGALVTDFVWWEGRPKLGFVQFESSDEVKRILAALDGHQFQLRIEPDQICHVKGAAGGGIPDLEWKELLAAGDGNGSGVIVGSDNDTDTSSQIPTRFASQHSTGSNSSNNNRTVASSPITIPPGIGSCLGLRHHLKSILRLIEIAEDEYNAVLDLHTLLQQTLQKKEVFMGSGSILFNAFLCRNWLLRLHFRPRPPQPNKPPVTNVPILIQKNLKCKEFQYGTVSSEEFKKLEAECFTFSEVTLKQLFYYSEVIGRYGFSYGMESQSLNFRIREPTSDQMFEMWISSQSNLIVEHQTWSLLNYLCTFDPHCYPVMALAYYWAEVNSIRLGGNEESYENLPAPSALSWLVILFFQMQGYIPPTNVILEEEHECRQFMEGTDIGFSDCTKFAMDWRTKKEISEWATSNENFPEEVFSLLYKFFLFCGNLLGEEGDGECSWVLNTRHAKIIAKKDLNGRDKRAPVENFCPEECRERINMLQPFNVNWRISTNNAESAFGAMLETGRKMKSLFENRDYKLWKDTVELDEFLKLFKVSVSNKVKVKVEEQQLNKLVKSEKRELELPSTSTSASPMNSQGNSIEISSSKRIKMEPGGAEEDEIKIEPDADEDQDDDDDPSPSST